MTTKEMKKVISDISILADPLVLATNLNWNEDSLIRI